jgi:outer membrane protein
MCLAAALAGGCAGGEAARDRYVADSVAVLRLGGSADAARLAAEVAQRGELTLNDCFRLALQHGTRLRARGEAVVQADAGRREAIGALLPQIGAHGQLIRAPEDFRILINVVPATRLEYWFQASQSLFDAKAIAALRVASETRDIEKLRLEDERDRLLFEVATAFYEIASLESDRAALAARLARAREQLRVVGVEVKAGQARPEQVFEARAEGEQAEITAVAMDEQIERARLRLSRLVGLSPLPARLRDSFEVKWSDGGLPELVEAADRNRLDLKIAEREVGRAMAQRRQVRAEYLPSASAVGTYWGRRQDLESDIDWTVGIFLDWSLFDGGAREARHARAESAVRNARLELEETRRAVHLEVEEALIGLRSLDRLIALLTSRARTADEALDRASTSLKAGSATELFFLRAQEAKAEAARDLQRAHFARTLAALRIRLVMGDLRSALEAAA